MGFSNSVRPKFTELVNFRMKCNPEVENTKISTRRRSASGSFHGW
jgi:hypothetical protein